MKIAIAGKGGVGKTTISGTLCRIFGAKGDQVLAIDGDPNPNLSIVLGIDKSDAGPPNLSTDIIERVETEDGKWKFQVKIPFQEVLETYGQKVTENVTLLMVGKPEQAGTGCLCGPNTVVRELVNAAMTSEEGQVMVLDTEASLEHMTRGTSKHVDKIYTVVEPYYRSLEAASRFAEMAEQLGIGKVEAIANKVRTKEDEMAIREYCAKINLPIAVFVPFDEQVTAADLKGKSVMDFDPEAKVVKALEKLRESILAE